MKKELIAIALRISIILVAIVDLAYLIFLACLISFLAMGNAALLPFLWTVTLIVIIFNAILLCLVILYLIFRKQ